MRERGFRVTRTFPRMWGLGIGFHVNNWLGVNLAYLELRLIFIDLYYEFRGGK